MCRAWQNNTCPTTFPCCHPRTLWFCAHTGVVQPFHLCFHLPHQPSSPNDQGNTLAFIITGYLYSMSPLLPHQVRCSVSFLLPTSSLSFDMENWLALGSSRLVFFCAAFERTPSKFNRPHCHLLWILVQLRCRKTQTRKHKTNKTEKVSEPLIKTKLEVFH